MARMRDTRAGAEARAGCEGQARRLRNLAEREPVELWRHLAQEPCIITLFGVLFRPLPVPAMVRGVRLAAMRVCPSARSRIRSLAGLLRQRLAGCGDRALSVSTTSAR